MNIPHITSLSDCHNVAVDNLPGIYFSSVDDNLTIFVTAMCQIGDTMAAANTPSKSKGCVSFEYRVPED